MSNNKDNTKDDAAKNLLMAAEKVKEQGYESRKSVIDIVKSALYFLVIMGIGFCWMMLMLLIISFVSLGYLHMRIEKMFIISGITAILVGIWYIIRTVVKKR
jgi:hypothetical protein